MRKVPPGIKIIVSVPLRSNKRLPRTCNVLNTDGLQTLLLLDALLSAALRNCRNFNGSNDRAYWTVVQYATQSEARVKRKKLSNWL